MIKAIETKYKGYKFRSRLEARWAVFFDALGIKWEYEKEGYALGDAGLYLPDFWLPGISGGAWIEIKGEYPTDAELIKAEALCDATKKDVYVFVGPPWFSIARAVFTIVDDGHPQECSYWYEHMDEDFQYDYEQKYGLGCYYQGWQTFGAYEDGLVDIICLAESDDIRCAHSELITSAYTAALSARFEHGQKG